MFVDGGSGTRLSSGELEKNSPLENRRKVHLPTNY